MEKVCLYKMEWAVLFCRLLINCRLSAKENYFSFDKVDDAQFFLAAVGWQNYLYAEISFGC